MSTTYRVAMGVSHGSVKTCILAPFLRVLRAPLPGSTPTATRYALTGERGVRAAPPRDPPRSSPAAILPCRRAPAGTLTLHVAEAKWTRRRQRPGLRDSFAGRRMVAWGSADPRPHPGSRGGVASGAYQPKSSSNLQHHDHPNRSTDLLQRPRTPRSPMHFRVVDTGRRTAPYG